ncbi:MAG: G5 domain-containing protein [Oscillospiraceae bacterium]|nr:G5 domain-containing protein [Oscillospiraceae bacterium]
MANWLGSKLNKIFHPKRETGETAEKHVLQPDILEVEKTALVSMDTEDTSVVSEIVSVEASEDNTAAVEEELTSEMMEETVVGNASEVVLGDDQGTEDEVFEKIEDATAEETLTTDPVETAFDEPTVEEISSETVIEETAPSQDGTEMGTSVEELTAQMDNMPVFTGQPGVAASGDRETDITEFSEETEEIPEQAETDEAIEDVSEADPEEYLEGQKEEELVPEEEGEALLEEDVAYEDSITEDTTEEPETGEDLTETAEEESGPEVLEVNTESAEETPEADPSVAEDLSDLWGLNRSAEEIAAEEKKERNRRRLVRSLVALILAGVIGGGAYAYEQGYRINLFYEIQHSQEETETGNGRKKRPDSSEFEVKEENAGEEKTDEKAPVSTKPQTKEEEPVPSDEADSGKEKEFLGVTISKEDDPAKISEEGPTGNIEEPDQVTVEETGPVQTIEVEKAVNYYLAVDGSVREIRALPSEIKTVGQLLSKAGVTLSSDDIVEPGKNEPVSEGQKVKVTRIEYKQYTLTETIPGQAIERMTPVLRAGRTYEINPNSQADGEMEVTYLDKYVNGEVVSHEVLSSTVTKEPTDYILLVGANIAASPINGAQYTSTQIVDNAPSEYSAVYYGRCTAYNFNSGAYGASGMYLSQGMVAVDPNVIPYGSLLYITSSDGSFVYGWAIAADYCEASVSGSAVVDCFFDTYRESALFGARYLNVYVVEQLRQGDLAGYIAKEGMFRSRVPA